jgi:hypothetical protein
VWALQHFRTWLLHRHFSIETDHANTRWVLDYGMDKHNSKLQRWSAQLSEFDFEFTWKCGESMIEPDTLSRAPLPAGPDVDPPLESPMVTDLAQACKDMLAKPKPADATSMTAAKAKAMVIDRHKRAVAGTHKTRLTARLQRARALHKHTALCQKNSAFCPDHPPEAEVITTDLPMAWYERTSEDADIGKRLHGGQEGTTEGESNPLAPTLFIVAHGISTDAMAAQELGVNVVGGSEVDPNLAVAFSKRTGAKSYPGLIELIEAGENGEYPELHGLDIVTSGLPCPYRSNAGSLTQVIKESWKEKQVPSGICSHEAG